MEERGLHYNYIFILAKLILFLLILCIIIELTEEFLHEMAPDEDFKQGVLFCSVLSCFVFYTFIADLNNFYTKVQKFFFRSTFLAFLIPSLLILIGLGFFIFPKIFNIAFDNDVFLFLGGFAFTSHLIFVARDIKGHTFTTFINYLFVLSILYIINLVIFLIYVGIAYRFDMAQILSEGMKEGITLIQNLFSRILL
ncbi:MAG: hypothetical protein JSW40_08015 [Candidatus Omnitrophota bacterium]|nr:MAG: hypothetical protein JSW40_08015 [Candidatus Omnitrophota bacterium]